MIPEVYLVCQFAKSDGALLTIMRFATRAEAEANIREMSPEFTETRLQLWVPNAVQRGDFSPEGMKAAPMPPPWA